MKSNESNYIKRLKKKKEDALDFIIDRYLPLVRGTVYKILAPLQKQESIEECINDIFFSIWEHGEQFNGEEKDFKKWVYKISKYQAIDYYRKLTRAAEVHLEDYHLNEHFNEKSEGDVRSNLKQQCDIGSSMSLPEEQILLSERREEVLKLLNQLEPTDQKIFIMKYFLDIKPEEISKQLGITRSAVDNRVYRGKKKLSDHMAKINWEVI